MKHAFLALGAPVFLGLAAGNAHAALLGVTQTFPDVTLTAGPYLIYDHNGVNATTGRLTVVSGGVQLAEGAAAGGSTVTQSYFGTGDSVPNVIFNIDVNNTTGAFAGGSLSIGFGNATGAPRWSWQGVLTNFGSIGAPGSGTIFDATWTMSADQYQNMPATMAQFVNGALVGATGGLKINSSAAWGSTANFGTDWIYGSSPNSPTIALYTAGLSSPLYTSSTVLVDVFTTPVPLPAAAWLFISGLGLLAPIVRRRGKA